MVGASAITVINNARTMDGAGVLLILGAAAVTAVAIAALLLNDWLKRRAIAREPNAMARYALAVRLFGKRGITILREIEERRSR